MYSGTRNSIGELIRVCSQLGSSKETIFSFILPLGALRWILGRFFML